MIGFDPLGGGKRGFDAQWRERSQHGLRHRVVDLDGADVEAVEAAFILDRLAGAVIARRGGAAGVMGAQLASAVSADGKTLQQGGSLSHGAAARLMRPGMRVGADPHAIGLIGAPVDEALMMVGDEHGPLRLRQLAHPLPARTAAIERDLTAALAIGIGARIHRICQHMIDGDIAGVDPTDAAAVVGLERKRQTLAAQPQPDAADRSELQRIVANTVRIAVQTASSGWNRTSPSSSPQTKPTGRPRRSSPRAALLRIPPLRRARRTCNSASLMVPLRPSSKSIVEQRRMIDAVGIADERVGETAEIEQAVPIGIVACEAGHFEAEHDADMSERDFGGETGEAAALDDAGAGQAEVFVDHDDLLRRPAERGCLGDQSILTLRGFAIVLDLGGGGLAKIDVSCAAQMRSADLCDVTHRLPPPGWSADRLAR